MPDGTIALDRAELAFCSIDQIYRGSFTQVGTKQLLLAFSPCIPGDMGTRGSAVVVEEVGARWRVVTHEPGIDVDRCQQYRRADGRDGIACQASFAAPPLGGVHWFFWVDFAKGEGDRTSQMGKFFFNDFWASCDPDSSQELLDGGAIKANVLDFHVTDANKDGRSDVVVHVERARLAPSQVQKTISGLCKGKRGNDGPLRADVYLPKATTSKLVFAGDGDGFTSTGATQNLLDKWKSESPTTINVLGPP